MISKPQNIYTVLTNFLAAGALALPVLPEATRQAEGLPLAEDGWALVLPQPSTSLAGLAADPASQHILDIICVLVSQHHIAATYRVDGAQARLFVRVYVIPWDLPGSGGRLSLDRRMDEKHGAVLRESRALLRELLVLLRQDRSVWDACAAEDLAPRFFWPKIADNRTLLELYNDLPSPAPAELVGNIPGLQTTLHEYQRRTVSTMVAREMRAPGMADSPLYLPVLGVDGRRTFFFQPATMELVADKKHVPVVPGGILCEELGTGKTIMMISLILATLDVLPVPEEPKDAFEERTPTTPVALRHFPGAPALPSAPPTASTSRRRSRHVEADSDTGVRLPSLVEILLHQCRVQPPPGLALRESQDLLERRGLWAPLRANAPFYLASASNLSANAGGSPVKGKGGGRRAAAPAVRAVYLSAATLVIVPDTLQRQWQSEILKHCTGDVLRYLYVKNNDQLPDAPELATDYDLVLISHTRLQREAQKKGTDTYTSCHCPSARRTRVPQCTCSRRQDVSPLQQIRWKRLIIDEGHNTSESSADYARFRNSLSVQSKWAVTGTPTSDLLGLNFGSGSEVSFAPDVLPEDIELFYPDDDVVDDGDDADDANEALEGVVSTQRVWSEKERDSFRKLERMFSDFLGMTPFAQDAGAFKTFVTSQIFAADGPFPGVVTVFQKIMEFVMVRHRIEDVEKEVNLPTLHNETVLLDLDPYAVKTYNVIQAQVAVNAIDSERKDLDYLFHPANVASLREAVSNISHTMFWHAVDIQLVRESVDYVQKSLEKVLERNTSPEDIKLMQDSMYHLNVAMDDPVWVALQGTYSVFHRTEGASDDVLRAWSIIPPRIWDAYPTEHLISATGLVSMRNDMDKIPAKDIMSLSTIIRMGKDHIKEEELWLVMEKYRPKKAAEKQKSLENVYRKNQNLPPPLTIAEKKAKYEQAASEYRALMGRWNDGEPVKGLVSTCKSSIRRKFLELSPVKGVRVKNSTSTKLDFILNEVICHPDEKFLIFSASLATLTFVAEGLKLVGIRYLDFSAKDRQNMPTTFASSDLYRVLLMELKHGARGLNLVVASRVIFCEPVWKADVKSQAIKRVHRIGQTRTVVVKTLAIRGTSEEVMDSRSKSLKDNNEEFAKELTGDITVRDFIANPKFLPAPSQLQRPQLDIPLFDLTPPRPLTPPPQPVDVTEEAQPEGPPRKKQKRTVTFAV